jgi:hypothetical protein
MTRKNLSGVHLKPWVGVLVFRFISNLVERVVFFIPLSLLFG